LQGVTRTSLEIARATSSASLASQQGDDTLRERGAVRCAERDDRAQENDRRAADDGSRGRTVGAGAEASHADADEGAQDGAGREQLQRPRAGDAVVGHPDIECGKLMHEHVPRG